MTLFADTNILVDSFKLDIYKDFLALEDDIYMESSMLEDEVLNPPTYQTKAGKAHDFNRGMKGRTLELLWEKFQNNFVYIHVFVTTWHLKYDIIDT